MEVFTPKKYFLQKTFVNREKQNTFAPLFGLMACNQAYSPQTHGNGHQS